MADGSISNWQRYIIIVNAIQKRYASFESGGAGATAPPSLKIGIYRFSSAFTITQHPNVKQEANAENGTKCSGRIIAPIFRDFPGGRLCVLHKKRAVQRSLTGFAAGVMVAASVWSLLVPAMEQSADMGRLAFLPAVVGFWLGILFLLVLDRAIPHLHQGTNQPEGPHARLKRTTMLVLAVTLHNIPEGMAVGVVLAGWISGNSGITAAGTLALSLGIALQNFPEGAIISMPLRAEGTGKGRAFLYGVLSGVVEPLAAMLTILAAGFILPALPYLLSFAAGAMIYVVVEELIPEASLGEHSNLGTLFFAAGFAVMLALEVALG